MDRIPVDVGVVVYRRGQTWWMDLHAPGQHRRRFSLKTSDRTKALAIAREQARAVASGTWNVALSGTALEVVVRAFLDQRCASRHAESTRAMTATFFDRFLKWASRERLAAIDSLTAAHLESFLAWRRKNPGRGCKRDLSNASLNRELAWIRCLARWAVKRGFLRADFTAAVERFKETREVKFVPTPEEVGKLAVAVASPTIRDLVYFIANTGPRISDALSLQAADIDLQSRLVRFRGQKTKQPYDVRLNDEALEILRRRLLSAGGGFLFGTRSGTPLERHNVLHRLQAASRKAKLPHPITPHALRRFALTLNAGQLTPSQLQALANHRTYKTTEQFYVGRLLPTPVNFSKHG